MTDRLDASLPLGSSTSRESSASLESSTSLEWIDGTLTRVLYHSDRTGYGVVMVRTAFHTDLVAVGNLASLADKPEGAFLSMEGRFENHPTHGRQFRVVGLLDESPHTLAGMKLWLSSAGIKGVGRAFAERLVETFGQELPSVIRTSPERLTDVEGIGPSRAQAICEAWSQQDDGRALTILLRGLGLSQRLADRIRDRYGDDAARVVQTQPFDLAEAIGGIGFRIADQLARRQGLPADDPARVRAAVGYALDQAADQRGHCFVPRSELREAVAQLDVPVHALDRAIDDAEGAGKAVVEGERVWHADLYAAELEVVHELAQLRPAPTAPDPDWVAQAERYVDVALDPSQREAVLMGLRGGFVVVTGGPGTGKTTLLRVLLRAFEERGAGVKLASPTGRAARRLSEAAGMPASTLHRLLEYHPGEGGFLRSPTNPLEADVVVVDEASMVDLPLFAALLRACPTQQEGFCLVLVGDADQLPSVGPGQVLRDVVASGACPVARLSTVHRQAADSGILTAAQAIHCGEVPVSGERSGTRDVFLLDRPDPEATAQTLERVVSERLAALGFAPLEEVQVLTPTRRGPLGTAELNQRLQQRLNPDQPALQRGDREYRLGDRVLCVRNRYDVEVFNGDVGIIREVGRRGLEVDFDGRVVQWAREDLAMLDLAYAITVHKSQGSEYPAVVLALHPSHGLMLRRNLFYTAVTRARRFLCVVGASRAWHRAVRTTGGDERHTGLAERLAGLTGQSGGLQER